MGAKIAKGLGKKGEGLELAGRRMHRLPSPSTSALPSLLSMYFFISDSPLWTSDNSSVVCNSGTFVPQSLNTIFFAPTVIAAFIIISCEAISLMGATLTTVS